MLISCQLQSLCKNLVKITSPCLASNNWVCEGDSLILKRWPIELISIYQAISFSDKIIFNVRCVISLNDVKWKENRRNKWVNCTKWVWFYVRAYLIVWVGMSAEYRMQMRFSPKTYEWHLWYSMAQYDSIALHGLFCGTNAGVLSHKNLSTVSTAWWKNERKISKRWWPPVFITRLLPTEGCRFRDITYFECKRFTNKIPKILGSNGGRLVGKFRG